MQTTWTGKPIFVHILIQFIYMRLCRKGLLPARVKFGDDQKLGAEWCKSIYGAIDTDIHGGQQPSAKRRNDNRTKDVQDQVQTQEKHISNASIR